MLMALIRAGFLSVVGSLFMAIYMVILYRSPKYPRTHRKRWVIAGAGVWLLLTGMHTVDAVKSYRETMVPKPDTIIAALADDGLTAPGDLRYTAERGYTLLIPEGFRYLEMNQGSMCLYAVHAADRTTITVTRIPHRGKPAKVIDQMRESAVKSYPDFTVAPVDGLGDAIYFTRTAGRGEVIGIMAFSSDRRYVFLLTVASPSVTGENEARRQWQTTIAESFTM
ncbi:MAG: hypothetical protein JW781_03415 [Deltaproteobacteria bacterium]|nr:hypothetical protein [Candidatus Anaeroferrophillacea bacterium]